MLKVAVVTVGRSDYGILRPLLNAIVKNSGMELCLMVGNAHRAKRFGHTVDEIIEDGFSIAETIDCTPDSDDALDTAQAMGAGVTNFATAYTALKPDLLILLGDRYEALAAAVAAQPLTIPIAHIGGGAVTEGAMDDRFRHAITKLAQLHFVETAFHARVVRQLGEDPATVYQVGALGLDNFSGLADMPDGELTERFGILWKQTPVLVTLHPETLGSASVDDLAEETFSALKKHGKQAIITYPNADPDGQRLIAAIDAFADSNRDWFHVHPHLGTRAYFALMKRSAMMVGNSSSGIIEAGAFGLPVVDIGDRQKGRPRGPNVVQASVENRSILRAMQDAESMASSKLNPEAHPYGLGGVAAKIIEVIQSRSDYETIARNQTFIRFDLTDQF